MTVPSVGKILNDAQVSLAVHKKCVKQMIQRRHVDQDTFLPELCNAILPVLLEFKVRAPQLRASRRAADQRLPAVSHAPRPRVPSTPLGKREMAPRRRGDLSARSAFDVFSRPTRSRVRLLPVHLTVVPALETIARPVRGARGALPGGIHRRAPRGARGGG